MSREVLKVMKERSGPLITRAEQQWRNRGKGYSD
jgi:hypothetical protein